VKNEVLILAAHFYELLSQLGVDPKTETKTLEYLFSEDSILPPKYTALSLEKYINRNIFRALPMRRTFVETGDLRNALGISAGQLDGTFEKLFLFSEFLIALFDEMEKFYHMTIELDAHRQMETIQNNIKIFVDKSNHELINAGKHGTIIVEKNKTASQAVEFIDDQTTAIEVLEYNHYKLKGDLNQKQKILISLGNYIEPILKDRAAKAKYAELFSDVSFLLNNFNIRHNNKAGGNAKEFIITAPDATLELWYDRAYNMILSVILAKQNFEFSKELVALKDAHNW